MQDPIITRLHRIKGQVNAIEKMYKDKSSNCLSIVQQIQAARAALGKVANIVLSDEANRCADKGEVNELKAVFKKVFQGF